MSVLRRYSILSQQRVDLPSFRAIESAASNDFDTFVQTFATGPSTPYVMRGFNISMSGAIGGAASSLQMIVANGALLHTNASESGTFYMVPSGAPAQQLNSSTNTLVTGAFTPSSVNYIGVDYERFKDDSTSAQSYFWDPSSKSETTKNVPQAVILRYRIKISTTTPGANVLPIAIVITDSGNNVVSISDCRPLFGRLGRGGFTSDPLYVYPWAQGRQENASTSSSSAIDPFFGGDKSVGSLKDSLDALMTEIQAIKGTTFWYSQSSSGSLESLRQDLGNTVITGRGNISHSETTAGLLNWSDDINIQVVGSKLSYTLLANPTSTDVTLADGKVAYVTLVRGALVAPNLVFTNSSAVVTSVGNVAWTTALQPGDFVRVGSATDAAYCEILSVDSSSQVTLTAAFPGTSTGIVGTKAKYAYGSYQTSPSPATDRDIYIANRENVPRNENVFWLYLRSDNSGSTPRIYVRFLGIEIEQGETEDISDTISKQLLQYIGSPMETAYKPLYVSALNAGSVPEITDLSFGAASTISSNQYFFINSSGDSRQYYVWFNKNGTGVDPNPGFIYTPIQVAIATGQTNIQVAAAVTSAMLGTTRGDFQATQRAVPNNNQVRVTNTSAGTSTDAANFNLGSPFAINVVQQGTGVGNYTIVDSDNLTLSIKKLDIDLSSLLKSANAPQYAEFASVVSPISSGTSLTIPLNTRNGNIQQSYIVGSGTLVVYLNGQYLLLGGDFSENGASASASTSITILRNLVVGDVLEYRLSQSGGGGGGGTGAQGPAGPTGPTGANAITGPSAISTKTASYSVSLSDTVLLGNTTSGAIIFTLPSAATATGRTFWFKKISADANPMTVKGNGSELVDFANTIFTTVQGESFTVICDGTQFWVI